MEEPTPERNEKESMKRTSAPARTSLRDSVTPPAVSPALTLPAAGAPDESMVYDDKGQPFYIAVGQGPGHPPDQDHLYAKRGRGR